MWYLAQQTSPYNYQGTSSSSLKVVLLFYIIIIVLYVAASWRIFTKAGQAGWKAIIPIYSTVITLRIVGMSGWYVLLFSIPFINLILAVVVAYRLAKAFGYGIGMTILEFLFGIGVLIIAFGKAQYLGSGDQRQTQPPTPSQPNVNQPVPPAPPTQPVVQ